MAKLFSVEKSQFINRTIDYYRQNKVGQYSKFLDKTPIFLTYYHISTAESRVDVGTGGIEAELGARSPIRFNKITEFPVYNIPELKPDVVYDETGYDIDLDLSGLVILPNTIRPLPGDYMILSFPGIKEYLFRVNQVRYNTIQSNDFYEFDVDIKSIGDNLERKLKIDAQIVNEFKTIFELIGTDDRCFVQVKDIDTMNNLASTTQRYLQLYKDAYYDRDCNSFIFSTGYTEEGLPSVLYDPYLEKFIGQSHLYFVENQEETLVLHPNDLLDDKFNYIYSKTLYQALMDRDLGMMCPNIYCFMTPVTKRFSPFIMNRMFADSVKLVLGQNVVFSQEEIEAADRNSCPIWFSLDKLPCCGPTWTPGKQNQYFSRDFIYQVICGEITTKNYFEMIIFNYLHHIKSPISIKELNRAIDIYDLKTFYYLPMICYILTEYYDEYFKADTTLREV